MRGRGRERGERAEEREERGERGERGEGRERRIRRKETKDLLIFFSAFNYRCTDGCVDVIMLKFNVKASKERQVVAGILNRSKISFLIIYIYIYCLSLCFPFM